MPRLETTRWIGGDPSRRMTDWRSSGDPAQALGLSHKGRSWGLGPVTLAQGRSRLVAGILWSEEQGLATEASPHPTSRHHILPAIGGP